MALPDIHSFWTGPRLGPLEQLCLASFAERGHRVFLHSYEAYELPAGVARIDARELAPQGPGLVYRRNGSPALFADLYRLQIQKAGLGIWADTDVFAIRPLDVAGPWLIPAERRADGSVLATNALLKLPADSALLAEMLGYFADFRRALPLVSPRRRLKYRLQALMVKDFGLANMPWGITGPIALARLVERFGLWDVRGPDYADLFAAEGPLLFDPAFPVDRSRGMTAHFIHSQLPAGAAETPRPDSFYAWCVAEAGARTPFFRGQA